MRALHSVVRTSWWVLVSGPRLRFNSCGVSLRFLGALTMSTGAAPMCVATLAFRSKYVVGPQLHVSLGHLQREHVWHCRNPDCLQLLFFEPPFVLHNIEPPFHDPARELLTAILHQLSSMMRAMEIEPSTVHLGHGSATI